MCPITEGGSHDVHFNSSNTPLLSYYDKLVPSVIMLTGTGVESPPLSAKMPSRLLVVRMDMPT